MVASAIQECTVDHIVQALNRRKNPGPASLKQIREVLPKYLGQCDQALSAAIQQGMVWKYGIVRKSEQYWTEAPEVYATRLVEKKLQNTANGMTQTQLIKTIGVGLLKGVIEPHEFINSLISQSRLFTQPQIKKSKTVKYTLNPYDFVDRLVSVLVVQLNRVANANGLNAATAMDRAQSLLTHESVSGPSSTEHPTAIVPNFPTSLAQKHGTIILSDADVEELVLQAMREINPRVDDGDLVLISELRQRLDFQQIERGQVDCVLLNLFAARRIVLSKKSVGQATQLEREQCVADDDGNFYNTVALWRD